MKKKWNKIVEEILKMDSDMSKLSDSELRHKTDEFKLRLKEGTSLDSLLPEAFAVVRETAFRVVGMKPYPVQIMGGIAIHEGNIAEMATGEGKTLVSTMPAYLNALVGKGVHIVTVNDYLAKRDAEWMGKIHEFLGLSVGYILNDYTPDRRKQAYNCDITYITNNELGFDYLRDNMAKKSTDIVQRGLLPLLMKLILFLLMKPEPRLSSLEMRVMHLLCILPVIFSPDRCKKERAMEN